MLSNVKDNYALQYQQLLRDLKSTADNLLVNQVANVWCVYGGLNRLHKLVDAIIKHGYKDWDDEVGYWPFIQSLEQLQPNEAHFTYTVDCEYKSDIPTEMKINKASIWLYRTLENHFLSHKLSSYFVNKLPLDSFYHLYAFLNQEKYVSALLTCLRAIERNQPCLMSEIDPNLFLDHSEGPTQKQRTHRRCSSYPDHRIGRRKQENFLQSTQSDCYTDYIETGIDASLETLLNDVAHGNKCNRCKSLPNCSSSNELRRERSHSLPLSLECTLPSESPTKNIDIISPKKVKHVIIDNYNIVEHMPPLYSDEEKSKRNALASFSLKPEYNPKGSQPTSVATSPEYSLMSVFCGQKDVRNKPRKRFIDDGGMSVLPMATGYFPRPKKGQTLTSFLTSSKFAKTNAELDRENAHFSVSEAMIAAMEQIRCKRDHHFADEDEETDEEIIDLKQRIRLRRKQKLEERQRKMRSATTHDGKTGNGTETSVSPGSTTPDSLSDSISSDGIHDLELNETSSLLDQNGLSLSMASLYSDADLFKRPRGAPDGASDILSAEGVALSLISRFKDKQLPRASDLEWLVSEEDAPQALLPLPKSLPVNPDDDLGSTPLRGTREWAPPRAQIIFTCHPPPNRKDVLEKQGYRCASCSMRVAPQYSSRFRYCHYLGKYFCTGCHTNQVALIPGRVLQKWDFSRYPVSNFSYRLLEQMYEDPLFRIFDLNKNIGKRSKNIELCKRYRLGMCYFKDFIFTCRFAEPIREVLEKEGFSNITDLDLYSMQDLVAIRTGEMKEKLKYFIELCCRHTALCKLCLARGFICEICNAEEILFPWQLRNVRRCSTCGSCFHIKCWNPMEKPCPRCARRNKRKESAEPSTS